MNSPIGARLSGAALAALIGLIGLVDTSLAAPATQSRAQTLARARVDAASTLVATAAVTPAVGAAAKPRRPTKVAYLTFDDGPDRRYTPEVLALLRRYDARATFFMIGSQARANPGLVTTVRRQGHAIGNHTYSHPWLNRLPASAVRDQLRRTDAVLGRTTCMRPPGGFVHETVRSVARAEGKRVTLWTVDPADWRRPGAARITASVLGSTRPGSVILLHDGGGSRTQTVAALSGVLSQLSAQGYRFEKLPGCG